MSNLDSFSYPKPIFGSVYRHPSVYSTNEWNNMLDEDPVPPAYVPNPISHKFYQQVMGNSNPDRIHKARITQPQPRPRQPSHTSHTSQPTSKQVVMAGASWCGFTKKAEADHKKYGLNVEEVSCDKNRTHPVCQKTQAYPTYYQKVGSQYKLLAKGYQRNPQSLFK